MSQITKYVLSGPGGLTIDTINHIPPDGTGNFTIAAGAGIAITPGTNTITISTNGTGIVTLTSDAGVATESLGTINVLGGHDINTSASGSTLLVKLNNAITLGDLSSIIGSPALTVTTGDIDIVAGSINVPTTTADGLQGIIYKDGPQTWLHNYGTTNFFAGLNTGNLTLTVVSAVSNVAVGDGALDDLTTGNQNCAFGVGVMDHVATGSDNSAFGYHALNQLEESGAGPFNNNAAFGADAGFGLTSGAQNSFFGSNACNGLLTGSNNIVLGYLAAGNYDAAESSNIIIGNLGTASESNVIRIGTQGGSAGQQNRCFVAGITGVTTSNSNMVTIDTTTGQLGATAMGAGSIDIIDGDVSFVTGSTITLTGGSSGAVFTGNGTTTMTESFNFLAMPATTTTTGYIAMGGTKVFHTYDTIENSVYVGASSGNFTTTGFANTAVGQFTLEAVTSGNQNTAIGAGVLLKLTTGTFNTAIGIAIGADFLSGSNNVFIGYNAAQALVSGSDNIIIGEASGASLTGAESSNILISADGTAAESHAIHIGEQGSGAGQQNKCFIAGITGVSVSNTQSVTIDTTTGQLGAHVMPGPSMGTYTSVNFAASPYTVMPTDYYLSVDVTGGAVTILLPNAPLTATVFAVKDRLGLSASNNITVTTVGGTVLIDGATTFVINTAYQAIDVMFGGTAYEVF